MIRIKTLTGRTITIDAHPNDTIKQIKDKFQAKSGVPSIIQRLFFGREEMANKMTLWDCNIQPYSTLYLVLRLELEPNPCVCINDYNNNSQSDSDNPSTRRYEPFKYDNPYDSDNSSTRSHNSNDTRYTNTYSAVNEIKSDILEMKITLKQLINQMALFHQKGLEQDTQLKEIKALQQITQNRIINQMNCTVIGQDLQLQEIKELLKEINESNVNSRELRDDIKHDLFEIVNTGNKLKEQSEINVSNEKKMENIKSKVEIDQMALFHSELKEIKEMIITQNRVNGMSNNELNDEIKDEFSEHESIEIVDIVENELKVDAESVEIAVYNAEETKQKTENGGNELTEPESNANELREDTESVSNHSVKDELSESKNTFGDPKTVNEEFTKQYLDIPSHLVGEYLMVYNKCIENKDLTQVKDEIMAYLLSIGVKRLKEIKIAFWKDHIYANVRLTSKHVQDAIWKAKLFKEKATTLRGKGWKVRIYVNYDDRNTRKQNKASNVQTNQMRIIPFGVAGVGGFSLPPLALPAINLPFPAAGLPMPMPIPMINNNFTPMGYSINQNQHM